MFKNFRACMPCWLLATLSLVADIAVTAPQLRPFSLDQPSLVAGDEAEDKNKDEDEDKDMPYT